mmetsp:Transcript_80663/g.211772  ORF Transcript_80663/g.211772 Transcript_80663/m.211772 type:complete len:229 (-) Transcript_80663:14-700(-)
MCVPGDVDIVQGFRAQSQPQDFAPTRILAKMDTTDSEPQKAPGAQSARAAAAQERFSVQEQVAAHPHGYFIPEGDQLVAGVGTALAQMAAMASRQEAMTCFHSVRPPAMSIGAYLARIHKFFGCSDECYVVGLLYIDRLIKLHPRFCVSPLSGHRLLLMGMTLAAKFHDDRFYSNAFYAKVGGLTLKEFNMLESRFAHLLDWKFHVRPEEYELYHDLALKAGAAAGPC